MAIPKETRLKRILILLLLVLFAINFATGVIKFPELQRYFLWIYNYITAAHLSKLHDFSGLALAIFIIVHLIVKRKWLKAYLAINLKVSNRSARLIALIIVAVLALVAALIFARGFITSNRVTSLSAVEVNEYNGEKLGSVDDFRENSIKGVQHIDKDSYKLEISGLISTSSALSYDDILKLPIYQKVVTLNCVEGWSVKALWEGVLVKDLLKGKVVAKEAKTIIFYAADGYSTSFPLDYVLSNDIIIANKINGAILPEERGFPFQLVAEQKWGYKWIKWITKIELSSDTDYKGFWESRGYNNDGSLKGSKFAD